MNLFFRSTHASKKVFLHFACLSIITLNTPHLVFATGQVDSPESSNTTQQENTLNASSNTWQEDEGWYGKKWSDQNVGFTVENWENTTQEPVKENKDPSAVCCQDPHCNDPGCQDHLSYQEPLECDQLPNEDVYTFQDQNCQEPELAQAAPQPRAQAPCKPCVAPAYSQSSKISKLRPFPVVVGLLAVSILAVTLLSDHKHQHTCRSRSCCN